MHQENGPGSSMVPRTARGRNLRGLLALAVTERTERCFPHQHGEEDKKVFLDPHSSARICGSSHYVTLESRVVSTSCEQNVHFLTLVKQ